MPAWDDPTSARNRIAKRFPTVDGDDGKRQADQLSFGEVLTRGPAR
jgi:hypothetical protein